ncbi:MAG TPA: MFS transporter [Saprospiraceae bacterium]|nr:MFS transporter [Saprospiraceae bacterium]
MKYLTRTIWILSLISLFTDMASEMLYPVMPIYLKSIGFSIVLIGFLEGLVEAFAGLSKGYFGKISDQTGKRVPFVQLGYGLSAISKPLLALFIFPAWIFFVRTLDRLGKGIRTGARDALLSDEATPETKGRVFGFHRSMDTLGAVLGPAIALIYLHFYPQQYKQLFFVAFIPGVFALVASFLLKDKKKGSATVKKATSFFSFLGYWKNSPQNFRKVVIGLLAFALFNSSDVFLLLKMKQSGFSDTVVIGVYIFYNLIFALGAFPFGHMADKIGMKKTFITGLCLFAVVYLGMTFEVDNFMYYILFFLYGLYAACTDGVAKAWISNITDKKDTATAIGFYSGFQSICALVASSLTGFLWYAFSPETAFISTALVTTGVIFYFLLSKLKPDAKAS